MSLNTNTDTTSPIVVGRGGKGVVIFPASIVHRGEDYMREVATATLGAPASYSSTTDTGAHVYSCESAQTPASTVTCLNCGRVTETDSPWTDTRTAYCTSCTDDAQDTTQDATCHGGQCGITDGTRVVAPSWGIAGIVKRSGGMTQHELTVVLATSGAHVTLPCHHFTTN